MLRALEIAKNGLGHVAPNPLVGAVLVHNDKIISEGYHAYYGGSHAEVNALETITNADILQECTLYVTLEPCSHFGKTPPCTDLILRKGIKRVIIAHRDPFEMVNGSGIAKLRDSGMEVTTDFLQAEAYEMNRRFFVFHQKKRPYIILKWAQTADGFTDKERSGENDKEPFPISGKESARLVHLWRSQESAIMIGTRTALTDNPLLTVRHVEGNNPLRIVFDKSAKIPSDFNVYNKEAKTLIIGNSSHPEADVFSPSDIQNLGEILIHLYQNNIQSILVEGGTTLHHSFISAGLWDEARIIRSAAKLKKGLSAPNISGKTEAVFNCGKDQITILRNHA